jgi:hypothetical protein
MMDFDWMRFLRFMRFDFGSRRREALTLMFIPALLYSASAILDLLRGQPVGDWPDTSLRLGVVLGVVHGLHSYRAENQLSSAPFYLLLPVSHCEKFTSRWLLSFAIGCLVPLLSLTLLTNVFGEISALLGRSPRAILLPEWQLVYGTFGSFLFFHSMAMTAGLYFKRHPGIKLVLSLLAYGFVVSVLSLILAAVGLMHSSGLDWGQMMQFASTNEDSSLIRFVISTGWQWLMPALLYFAAYYRSVEAEVRG